MTNEEVKRLLGDTPHMSLNQAERLTGFMEKHAIENVLELGFAHGVSTCYMAAALERMGNNGHIVTIDIDAARKRKPDIRELLARTGQSQRVTVHFEPTSYNWRLMKFLEETPRPTFDLCYLDGAHSWFVDGFAFYLVDHLLKPGGWIILDDLDWTYSTSAALRDSAFVRSMSEEERNTPQVRRIYELLVKGHPSYHNFRTEDDWAFAQKRCDASTSPSGHEIVVEEVVTKEHYGLGSLLRDTGRRVLRYLGARNE